MPAGPYMILTVMLIAGTLLWAAGEAVALLNGTLQPADGWTACIGMLLAGAGVFALKDMPAMGKPGRVGIVLIAFGALTFSMVIIITLTSGTLGELTRGTLSYADIVFTPVYFLAVVFAAAGLFALARHFLAIPSEKGLGWGLVGLGGLTGVRPFIGAEPYHMAVSLLLALALLGLGVRRLRMARG